MKTAIKNVEKAVELRAMKEMQDPNGKNPPYKVNVAGTAIDYSGDRPTEGMALVDVNGNITLYMNNGAL